MSENKKLRLVEKIENAKPSNMDDEKKARVLLVTKRVALIAATVAVAVVAINTANYYSNLLPDGDEPNDQTEEN